MIASISQAFPRWAAGVLCFSMVLNAIFKIACGSIYKFCKKRVLWISLQIAPTVKKIKLQDRPSYYGQSLITFTPKSGPCKKWPLIMWRHLGANMMCCWFSWRHWWPQVPFNFYSTWVFPCPPPWLAVSVCGGAGWHSVLIHGPPLQTPCDWPPASCGALPTSAHPEQPPVLHSVPTLESFEADVHRVQLQQGKKQVSRMADMF